MTPHNRAPRLPSDAAIHRRQPRGPFEGTWQNHHATQFGQRNSRREKLARAISTFPHAELARAGGSRSPDPPAALGWRFRTWGENPGRFPKIDGEQTTGPRTGTTAARLSAPVITPYSCLAAAQPYAPSERRRPGAARTGLKRILDHRSIEHDRFTLGYYSVTTNVRQGGHIRARWIPGPIDRLRDRLFLPTRWPTRGPSGCRSVSATDTENRLPKPQRRWRGLPDRTPVARAAAYRPGPFILFCPRLKNTSNSLKADRGGVQPGGNGRADYVDRQHEHQGEIERSPAWSDTLRPPAFLPNSNPSRRRRGSGSNPGRTAPRPRPPARSAHAAGPRRPDEYHTANQVGAAALGKSGPLPRTVETSKRTDAPWPPLHKPLGTTGAADNFTAVANRPPGVVPTWAGLLRRKPAKPSTPRIDTAKPTPAGPTLPAPTASAQGTPHQRT